MSWITEVLILASSRDNNAERLGEVNAFFGPDGRGFADVERSAGGNKVWCSLLLAGAFNYIDLDALLKHLRTEVQWEQRDEVQVLSRREELDERFVLRAVDDA